MLGLGSKSKKYSGWQWNVCGKHPSARDFFALGGNNFIAEAFARWIRLGAEGLQKVSRENLLRSCSYRFWARVPEKGVLSCGVIRNSCDSAGRPYPLLVIGTGRLEHWEGNWDLLPFSCDVLWAQMERLASRKYNSLSELEDDTLLLHPPREDWDKMAVERQGLQEVNEDTPSILPAHSVESDALFLGLDQDSIDHLFQSVIKWNIILKENIQAVPNSLFLGGTEDHVALVLFRRSLDDTDFINMWMADKDRYQAIFPG